MTALLYNVNARFKLKYSASHAYFVRTEFEFSSEPEALAPGGVRVRPCGAGSSCSR